MDDRYWFKLCWEHNVHPNGLDTFLGFWGSLSLYLISSQSLSPQTIPAVSEPCLETFVPLAWRASASCNKSNDKAGVIPIDRMRGIKAKITNFTDISKL